VALGKPKPDPTRGDTIPALGGTYAGRARVANILRRRPSFRLAVHSAKTLFQVAPLKETRKKVGLGLDPQTVDSSLGPVGASQQYLAQPGLHQTTHTYYSQDTDRLISRQFAIRVQGLPSKDHYLVQEPMDELLKVPLHIRKQWLASAQSARERQKRRVAEQAKKYPEERQFMANWLLQRIPSIWYFQLSVRYRR
jgi:hypothetical protein